MKQAWRDRRPKYLGWLIARLVRAIGATLRFEIRGYESVQESPGGKIYCGWHGRSLPFAVFFKNKGVWVIISHSRDGEIQTQVFRKLGFRIIRGSSGRGGVRAAVEAIRALREGGDMAITPDGPRGPSGVVQGGIMLMAQRSGAALVPVGISARPRRLARSWDRYLIPLPWSKVLMLFGRPLTVPESATEEEVEQIRLRLQEELHRIEREAEAGLGLPTDDRHSLPS